MSSSLTEGVLENFGTIVTLARLIYERITKRQEKYKFYKVFFKKVGSELLKYAQSFDEAINISDWIKPMTDAIGERPTTRQINSFCLYAFDSMEKFSNVVLNFVNLSRVCKEMTLIPSMMEDLKKHDKLLLDFTVTMANILTNNNKIKIGSQFYVFLKTHSSDVMGSLEESFEEDEEEISIFLEVVKDKIMPNIKSHLITRHTKIYGRKKIRLFNKRLTGIKIDQQEDLDYSRYIPPKMLATIELIGDMFEGYKVVF